MNADRHKEATVVYTGPWLQYGFYCDRQKQEKQERPWPVSHQEDFNSIISPPPPPLSISAIGTEAPTPHIHQTLTSHYKNQPPLVQELALSPVHISRGHLLAFTLHSLSTHDCCCSDLSLSRCGPNDVRRGWVCACVRVCLYACVRMSVCYHCRLSIVISLQNAAGGTVLTNIPTCPCWKHQDDEGQVSH